MRYLLTLKPLGTHNEVVTEFPTGTVVQRNNKGELTATLRVYIEGDAVLDANREFFARINHVLNDPDYFASLVNEEEIF